VFELTWLKGDQVLKEPNLPWLTCCQFVQPLHWGKVLGKNWSFAVPFCTANYPNGRPFVIPLEQVRLLGCHLWGLISWVDLVKVNGYKVTESRRCLLRTFSFHVTYISYTHSHYMIIVLIKQMFSGSAHTTLHTLTNPVRSTITPSV